MAALFVVGALLLAVVLLLLWAWQLQAGGAQAQAYEQERALMPAELRDAVLVVSERTLHADEPVPLVARVDQVFFDGTWLIPVETKTRAHAKIYPADLLELGVQAAVLSVQTGPGLRGRRVAPFGYVRLVLPGLPPRYQRVDLPDQAAIVGYYHRFRDLHAGRLQPRPPFDPAVCRSCPHAKRCRLAGTRGPRYVPSERPLLSGKTA